VVDPHNFGELHDRFAAWVSDRVGAHATIGPMVVPGHGGFSNETFVTTADWGDGARGIVLRLAPAGTGLFPDYDLDRQARILQLLRTHTDVPVPEVLWAESDTTALGRPFYVMARVDGRIPPDRPGYLFEGWVKDASSDDQSRVLDNGLGMMAHIHHVDWQHAGLDFLDRQNHGDGAIGQELGYWRAYLDWAGGDERFDLLETIWEWCVAHRPPEPAERRLVWGDARLGNLVYADDCTVRAVLDWEMAVLGPPELDLGWYLFLDRLALSFAEPLPGFAQPDDQVRMFESHVGRRVEHLDWYETWGGFRAACIQIPLVTLAHSRGEVPDLAGRGDNPLTADLLRRIG
jgi:aminoglycoside phosphotransferase (APT) family kinase protein